MIRALNTVLSLVIALVLGALSAAVALDRWPQMAGGRSGAWLEAPGIGDPEADPYSAALAQTRLQLPMGEVESSTFIAVADDGGQPLDAACAYRVTGGALPARLFTLRAEGITGEPLVASNQDGPALPPMIHSENMLFAGDGFELTLSAQAAPGNWLPLRSQGRFRLVLSAYDAALSDATFGTSAQLPSIVRLGCADA
ncbi:MAG: DUF1214 domain-containing protein [Rhizobiaceae bacterium]|nr:DUF1214 domain-containing protein [Rhizobiaceae bacterium]